MKTKVLFLLNIILLLIFSRINAVSQTVNFNWANNAGGTLWDGSRSVTTDKNGNVYITGEFQGQAIFDTSVVTSANFDLFLAKYSEIDGSLIWVKQATANQDIFSVCVVADNDNNVFITGVFYDTLSIGDTIIPAPVGLRSLFLAKYDENGQFLWARTAYSDDQASSYYIEVNSLNEVYLVAMFRHTISFSDTTLTALPSRHSVAIAKFSSSGSLLFTRKISGDDCVHAGYVHIDNADNYYISGVMFDNADFGDTILQSSGGANYLVKFNNNDQFVWIKTAIGANFSTICTDNDNNVYSGGQISANTVIENINLQANGITDIFIAKYNPFGNFIWVKQAGGNGEDNCNTICINGNNELYIAGGFNDVAYFNNDSVVSIGGRDMYIAKFDSSGNFNFVNSFGSIYDDDCNSIAYSSTENLFLTGIFTDELFWENDSLAGYGSEDAFLAVLSNDINNVQSNSSSPLIRYYPNPCDEFISVDFPEIEEGSEIELMNIMGQSVYFRKLEKSENRIILRYDVSVLPKGIYILKISGINYFYSGKLFKK